jgi:hypothetical protein
LSNFYNRLSNEIHFTEFQSPNRSRFREGHTKVEDIEKIYLTGLYKAKYKMLSDNLAENINYKLFPPPAVSNADLLNRKIRQVQGSLKIGANFLK